MTKTVFHCLEDAHKAIKEFDASNIAEWHYKYTIIDIKNPSKNGWIIRKKV